MKTICLHGAESTGKSTIAAMMAQRLGASVVPEYGRHYCETRGTRLAMDDLLAIAEGQERWNAAARAQRPPLLVLDTDQLMTAAWARMLFGQVPPRLWTYPRADLYLSFAPDVPWIEDGTRFFGNKEERARFAAIARDVLVEAGAPFVPIAGDWAEREAAVLAATDALAGAA